MIAMAVPDEACEMWGPAGLYLWEREIYFETRPNVSRLAQANQHRALFAALAPVLPRATTTARPECSVRIVLNT